MNKKAYNRRYDISASLIERFGCKTSRNTWKEYADIVWPSAEVLCQSALEEGVVWTKSLHSKLFNMTLTSVYDAYQGKRW